MTRMFLKALAVASVGVAALGATPAAAYTFPACDVSLMNPTAASCVGYYASAGNGDGNLLSGNSLDRAAQAAAVTALTGDATIFDGSLAQWNVLDANWKIDDDDGDTPFDFGVDLLGDVVIGVHWGNVAGAPQGRGAGNVSAFYLFHLGNTPQPITLNDTRGWSNAVLYLNGTPPPPGVPEPATWAMMLLGFGAAGTALRRSRRRLGGLPQIA